VRRGLDFIPFNLRPPVGVLAILILKMKKCLLFAAAMPASNPSDSFDPTDLRFAALDASALSASFSRRYRFMVDAMSDSLPANTQMWIRKHAGPAAPRTIKLFLRGRPRATAVAHPDFFPAKT
jgi:hypothetical protein